MLDGLLDLGVTKQRNHRLFPAHALGSRSFIDQPNKIRRKALQDDFLHEPEGPSVARRRQIFHQLYHDLLSRHPIREPRQRLTDSRRDLRNIRDATPRLGYDVSDYAPGREGRVTVTPVQREPKS